MATDVTLQRSLPHNLEAERSVLGAILLDNQALNPALEILRADDFFLDAHRRIFIRMIALSEANRAIDLVTLADELTRAGEGEAAGGIAYLSSLVDGVPRVTHVTHYAKIVKEKSLLRSLIHTSNNVIEQAFEAEEQADEILDRAEQAIFGLAEERVKAGFLGIQEIVKTSFQTIEALYERGQRITGLATGFTDFDNLTSGLQPAELIVLAGRPSMGKTALALNIAEDVAVRQGKPVGLFSVEMAKESLLLRLLCSEARVNAHKLRTGYLGKEEWGKMTVALGRLAEAPIFIDDSPTLTVLEMRSKARRLKVEHDLGLIIVDYLQLLATSGRFESRRQEIDNITRGLKALAKEMYLPVIAISQLSRAPETRGGDHRPQLSDLRESGSIEQDADLVAFIFRPEMYRDPETVPEEERGRAELIVAKQRNGPVGKVRLAFLREYTRFENLLEFPEEE
ncbi:MAG: replicative DNA helicase [Terriglobia bacterium]